MASEEVKVYLADNKLKKPASLVLSLGCLAIGLLSFATIVAVLALPVLLALKPLHVI